jgi:hypothetical protein
MSSRIWKPEKVMFLETFLSKVLSCTGLSCKSADNESENETETSRDPRAKLEPCLLSMELRRTRYFELL